MLTHKWQNFKKDWRQNQWEYLKLRQLYYIGIDSIVLDPTVLETFYFKHDVGASYLICNNNFYGQPWHFNAVA